jgi:hypothetical protein
MVRGGDRPGGLRGDRAPYEGLPSLLRGRSAAAEDGLHVPGAPGGRGSQAGAQRDPARLARRDRLTPTALRHRLAVSAPAGGLDRLSELPDGRIAIRLKRPLEDGSCELRLEPTELLCRLATLVPPPRAHVIRFHGVFGPASKWRSEIVPAAPARLWPNPESHEPPDPAEGAQLAEPAKPRRPDAKLAWAEMLQRVFREDVLLCPCGGRRRVIAFITDRKVVKTILEHLGLPTTGPPVAQARSKVQPDPDLWQDDVPILQEARR